MPDGSLVPYRPAPTVLVRTWEHPLRVERAEATLPAGGTVADLLDATEFPVQLRPFAQVWLADAAMAGEPLWIPEALWHRVRPKAGTVLTVRVVPGKKGGGKGFLGIILGIVAAAASIFIPGTTGALIGAGIGLVGKIVTSLIGAPKAPKQSGGGIAVSPTYSVSGTRNEDRPFSPIPRIYGRHRITPPLGARPFTEIVGDDQFLRMVFCFGYGPLELTDLKIGETPLESFDDVEYEVRQGFDDDAPLTLYTADVFEEPLSVELLHTVPVTQTSQPNADELSVDFTFDRGLVLTSPEGVRYNWSVTFKIEYRVAGSGGAWTTAGNYTATAASQNVVRRGFRWTLPSRGQYEVRITRTSAVGHNQKFFDHAVWTALRSIRQTPPIEMTGLALVAVRIRATNQLNGVIDQFNGIATSMLPTITEGSPQSWSAPVATRNPAWAYLDALRGKANKRPIADARIDLPAFAAWAADCDEAAQDGEATFTFDGVFDFEITLFDALKAIAAAGRASFAMVDGKFSIVQDKPQTVPIQHFTPRNSFGFRSSKSFPDLPHALKVQFVNEEAGWQKDEVTVYADGFDESTATKFEALETFGITRYQQAWREGRYHQAVARLRPEVYELSTDIEHIVCKRGDLIRVSHDVPRWGSGWGRIKALTDDGASPANVTAITLDERVTMAAAGSYVLRVRRANGDTELHAITTVAGESATLQLATPVLLADAPEVGDLAMFGQNTLESIEGIVTKIEPEPDFGARITFVDAAPNIHEAYTGSIPAFDSKITEPLPIALRTPARPIVENVQSNESVLVLQPDGSLQARILITLAPQSAADVPTAAIEVLYRRTGTDGAWERLPLQPAGAAEVSVLPVDDATTYDIRLRAISATGAVSEWTSISGHTVIGKTSPPPDVINLRREGSKLRWTLPEFPADLHGYIVRHRPGSSALWDDATDLVAGVLTTNEVDITDLIGGGTRAVMVKAIDVAGNVSDEPAYVVLELGDPVVDNVVNLYDWSGEGFSDGTIVNGTVSFGELVAITTVVFWSGNNGAPFWSGADGKMFWTADYEEMTFTVHFIPAPEEVGARLILLTEIEAGSWDITYRTGPDPEFWTNSSPDPEFWADSSPDQLFWSALDGDFVPWPGEITLENQQYEIRVRTSAGLVQGVVRLFQGVVDLPDIEEFFEDIAIAALGSRLPLSDPSAWRSIRSVLLTLQDDGGAAVTARVLDKDITVGPLVECLDLSGVATTGLVDAHVQGVAA